VLLTLTAATHGEDHDPELHLIPLVLQGALGEREKISVFGDNYPTPDGTCIRDYIHVQDQTEAHILALGALEQGNRTYHLGTGRGFSVKKVVAAAERVTGKKISVEMASPRTGDPECAASRRHHSFRPGPFR
jgi:UDP-glucose 4-epimerase